MSNLVNFLNLVSVNVSTVPDDAEPKPCLPGPRLTGSSMSSAVGVNLTAASENPDAPLGPPQPEHLPPTAGAFGLMTPAAAAAAAAAAMGRGEIIIT